MNAVIITLERTAAMDKALLAGWEIVGAWPSHYPGPMGGPTASTVVALRGRVSGCDGGLVDTRKGDQPPEEWFS